MKWRTALALVLLAFALAGCAASHTTWSSPSPSPPPHVRCLADPQERGTRPLIFLFCIESP